MRNIAQYKKRACTSRRLFYGNCPSPWRRDYLINQNKELSVPVGTGFCNHLIKIRLSVVRKYVFHFAHSPIIRNVDLGRKCLSGL